MGLLDYYRQFDDISEEEVNRERRARRARERALELEKVPTIDLSRTEWPELPHSEIVNASIAAARGRVNAYPDRHAAGVRELLAARHAIAPEQIVLGNGASELLQAAVLILSAPDDEILMPWPSYPLFPLLAQRARSRPVTVPLRSGRVDADSVLAAITPRTALVIIANPNDPTGTYLRAADVRGLLEAVPEHVHVILDEAFIHFQDVEEIDACLQLVDSFPRLLVVRTFSKIYGLSGLRAGYAVASADSGSLLASLAPPLGVSVLTQAGVAQALRIGDKDVARRRGLVIAQRRRIIDAFHDLPVDATDSRASFVWLRAAGLSGAELTARLERAQVLVAPGGPLGDDDHVRASIRGRAETDRLLAAVAAATGAPAS